MYGVRYGKRIYSKFKHAGEKDIASIGALISQHVATAYVIIKLCMLCTEHNLNS